MESFARYLEQQIDCYEEFHTGKFFSDEKAALVGAVLLDSIYYPLYEYMDVILSTDFKYDYSYKPIDYLNQIAKKLQLIDYDPDKQRRNTKLGNPFVDVGDYNRLFGLAPLFKEDGEIEIASERLSEADVDLKRNKGLYILLQNISSIMDIIVLCISKDSSQKIKALFLLYALNRKFNILNHYFLPVCVSNHYIYSFLYLNCNEITPNFKKNQYVSSIIARRIAKYIMGKNQQSDDFDKFLLSILNDAVSLSSINTFVCEDDFWNQFYDFSIQFKTYLQIDATNPTQQYTGLKSFFLDMRKSFPNNEAIELATQDNKSYMKAKHELSSFKYYVNIEPKEIMINPFIEHEMDYGEINDIECPFYLYRMPLCKLFDFLAEIENSLETQRDCAQTKKEFEHYKTLRDNMINLCNPLWNILKKDYTNLCVEEIYAILQENLKTLKIKCNNGELNENDLYKYLGKNISNAMEQVRRKVNNIQKKIDQMHDTEGENQLSVMEEILDSIFDPIIFRYVLAKARKKTQGDVALKRIRSFYRKFMASCIRRKYKAIQSRILGKKTGEVIDNQYHIFIDSIGIELDKPFPYVEKCTASEWRYFFDKYCHISDRENMGFLACEKGNRRPCKKHFLEQLRNVYIKEFIKTFSIQL